MAGEDAHQNLRGARDTVRQTGGRDKKDQQPGEEYLRDSILNSRHHPGYERYEPTLDHRLQGHLPEPLLHLANGLAEQEVKSGGTKSLSQKLSIALHQQRHSPSFA